MNSYQIGGIAAASLLALTAFTLLAVVYLRSRPRPTREPPRPDGAAEGSPLEAAELLEDLRTLSIEVKRGIDSSLSRLEHVPGHANHEEVADAAVENDFGRHARIGAGENGGER